jgi:hypothetical protein
MNTTEIETNHTERINLRVRPEDKKAFEDKARESLNPDEVRQWMDRRWPDTNPFCDRFGFISVVYKCGHKFGLRHSLSTEDVTQELYDRTVAHALTRICDDCWCKREYPRFIFALDSRSVEVEGAHAIHSLLKQRAYRFNRSCNSWSRRFPSKKACAAERAWTRKRRYNSVGWEKRHGTTYMIDFATDRPISSRRWHE